MVPAGEIGNKSRVGRLALLLALTALAVVPGPATAGTSGGITWSGDSRWIAYCFSGPCDTRVVPSNGGRPWRVGGAGIYWAPRGDLLAISTENSLELARADGSHRVRLGYAY